jgi:predicted RNase H-like nuclease
VKRSIPSKSVLALDASWTPAGSSGVALVEQTSAGWVCRGLAPSYAAFVGLSRGQPVDWSTANVIGSPIKPADLLAAASSILGGGRVTVVAIDMPIATVPIVGRRFSDNQISSVFGRQGCSTHSPGLIRPGQYGHNLTRGFQAAGYAVATGRTAVATADCMIEVYPHPAIVKLMKADFRLPYKISKSAKLWSGQTVDRRIGHLLEQFTGILDRLRAKIHGIDLPIPPMGKTKTLSALKRYEDGIDALVSAWVGIGYLNGTATAYGDHISAIWVP